MSPPSSNVLPSETHQIFALVEVIVYIQSIPSLVLETEVNIAGLNGEQRGIVANEIQLASLFYFKVR